MKAYRVILESGDEELLLAPDLATARQLANGLGEDVERIIAEGVDDEDESDGVQDFGEDDENFCLNPGEEDEDDGEEGN